MTPSTFEAATGEARSIGVDRLDAQLLLAHVAGRSRSWVIAHADAPLSASQWRSFDALARERSAGVPLAYLVAGKEFRGLWLELTRDVLVPRPDTECLVDRGLEALERRAPGARVLDLGTGSGAIALAMKAARPDAHIAASDAEPRALDVARANGARLHLDIEWRLGHWWKPWTNERFDVVLSNPPYIAAGDAHLAALQHEPNLALVSGSDGLDAIRELVAGAPSQLAADGWIWVEHGHDQAPAVCSLMESAGFGGVETKADLSGVPRVTGGRRM